MNQRTISALNQLNQDFYRSIAPSFSGTRHYAWNSWSQYAAHSRVFPQESFSFLDVGCGNGRLGSWLLEYGKKLEYTGIDSSPFLLQEAQNTLPEGKFFQKDIVELLTLKKSLLEQEYSCIAVFGVLHHIPSFELRKQFLQELSQRVKTGGEIWITAWQPQGKPLSTENVCMLNDIKPEELEEGDVFFGWKDSDAIRYVHILQEHEMRELLRDTSLEIEMSWKENSAGERENLCFLLHKK